jgi:hypothetical protein
MNRITRTLVTVAAAAAAAALPAAAQAKPQATKQATFEATLSGSQVTTWEYHQAEDEDDPCDASSNGYGDQTIKFDAGRKVRITFTAPPKRQPNLFLSNGRPAVITAPILFNVDATAERNGDYTVNYNEIKQDQCDGVSGGDGGGTIDKDCGTREGRFQTRLYFHEASQDDELLIPLPRPAPEKNHLKLEGIAYEWGTPEGGSAATLDSLYLNCPLLLQDAYVEKAGNIFISPAKLSEKALFNRKRRKIVVSGHHIAGRGGGGSTGQTILAWNLRLKRVK